MKRKDFAGCVWLVIAVATIVGCAENKSERIADYAMESARWQAEQSQTLVEANQNIADGSRGLVTADAASRQELATLQRELRADQAAIGKQYEELAENHTQWVQSHERDEQAGSSILGIAFVLACLAPFVLAAGALFHQDDPPSGEEIDAVVNNR